MKTSQKNMAIYFETLIVLFTFVNNIKAQDIYFVPGARDFICRVLNSDFIPLPTSGIDGALRNPANYGGGISLNKQYFGGPIEDYLKGTSGKEELNLGTTFKFILGKTRSIDIGLALGFSFSPKDFFYDTIDYYNAPNDNGKHIYEAGMNPARIIGLRVGGNLLDKVRGNVGFISVGKGILFGEFGNSSRTRQINRFDFAADVTGYDFFTIGAVKRSIASWRIIGYDKNEKGISGISPFPNNSTSISTAIYYTFYKSDKNSGSDEYRKATWQIGLLKDIYSSPSNIEHNGPIFFIRGTSEWGFQMYHKDNITYFWEPASGEWALYFDNKGRITLGINAGGLSIIYGHNSLGENWCVTWIFGGLLQ